MSDTKVDMPKVCQMLDSGWTVTLFKNQMGSYTAIGEHEKKLIVQTAKADLHHEILQANPDWDFELIDSLTGMDTDDFTPEQALTRLAYKVHGEII